MRKSLGILFAFVLLCGLGAVILATPRPQPNPNPIRISINCDVAMGGVDTPFFDIEYANRASTTIQWTNNCSFDADIQFKADTPLTEVDSNGKTIKVRDVTIAAGQMSKEYGVMGVPAPPPNWDPTAPPPKSKKHYKIYKYDITVGGTIFDPGGGVRP